MPRQFLANLSFIILLNLIVKPFYILGIEVSVQNVVGAGAYGIFFALLNSAYLFQILNDFGIQIYNNRRVAQDADALSGLFGGLIRLKLLLAVVFLAVVLCFTMIVGYAEWIRLTIPIAFNLVLVSLLLFLRSGISGLGFYRADSILSVLDKLLMILICGYLLLTVSSFSIFHFVYAQTASLALSILVAVWILKTRHNLAIRRAGLGELRTLLVQSGPYALAIFLMSLYTRVDGVMIEQLARDGPYETGMYAAGFRLLDAASMIAFLFAVLLLPMFSKALRDRETLWPLLDQGFRLMWTLTISLSLVCFAFRAEVMQLLYDEMTARWAGVFGLLILSFNGIGMMYVFGTFLTARGEMRSLNRMYGGFVVLNVAINFALIPQWGAWGAAIATLITQSLVALSLFYSTCKVTGWRPDRVLRILLFLIGAVGLSFLGHLAADYIPWIASFFVTGICLLIYAFSLRIVQRSEFSTVFSRRRTPD